LDADEDVVLLGDRSGGLDQFDVGGGDAGGELHGSVALLLQVGDEFMDLGPLLSQIVYT
jgi:hypothetical protein